MTVNRGALLHLIGNTTFVPLFIGLCALLVGLGIGDQPFLRQVAGFLGALMTALVDFRPHRDVNLAEKGERGLRPMS